MGRRCLNWGRDLFLSSRVSRTGAPAPPPFRPKAVTVKKKALSAYEKKGPYSWRPVIDALVGWGVVAAQFPDASRRAIDALVGRTPSAILLGRGVVAAQFPVARGLRDLHKQELLSQFEGKEGKLGFTRAARSDLRNLWRACEICGSPPSSPDELGSRVACAGSAEKPPYHAARRSLMAGAPIY